MARRFGLPEVGPVAGDEDDRSGRSRIGGSVHNDYGRTTLSVQLRISEIDAAGETVATVTGPTLERVPGQGRSISTFRCPTTAARTAWGASFSSTSPDPRRD